LLCEHEDPPLGDNDVAILSEMLAIGANADAPQTRKTIIGRLGWDSEGKRAFNNLKDLGYVNSAGNLGYFLTEAGEKRAKQLG
jgi:Mn-dependent DtxR family transcriptional regulator